MGCVDIPLPVTMKWVQNHRLRIVILHTKGAKRVRQNYAQGSPGLIYSIGKQTLREYGGIFWILPLPTLLMCF